jgi:hypothetical protein
MREVLMQQERLWCRTEVDRNSLERRRLSTLCDWDKKEIEGRKATENINKKHSVRVVSLCFTYRTVLNGKGSDSGP